MQPFSYSSAERPDSAVSTVTKDQNALYIAGGTSLIDLMKLNIQTPDQLADINELQLSQISVEGNKVRVGAMARNSDVAYHDTIRQRYPVLSEALLSEATHSCEIWQQRAEVCCKERNAITSGMKPRPVTSAYRVQDVGY